MKHMTEGDLLRLRSVQIPVTKGHSNTTFAFSDMFSTTAIMGVDEDSLPPTDEEIRLLRLELEYTVKCIYRPSVLEGKIYATVQGHNTQLFLKSEAGWQYRRASWYVGPTWIPVEPRSLKDVIIHSEHNSETFKKWLEEKLTLPDA